MDDIRYKINVVAAIAAAGAIIAFIGCIMSWNQFPNVVGFIDMVIYGSMSFVALVNIKPTTKTTSAIWNSFLGILGIAVAAVNYTRIADNVGASSFMDVGLGIWLMFAGMIVFTIFSFSDWLYKRKQ